jgi:hypothetical protein
MGRGRIGITVDLYSHVTATMQRDVVEAFEELSEVRGEIVPAPSSPRSAKQQLGRVAQSVRAADS